MKASTPTGIGTIIIFVIIVIYSVIMTWLYFLVLSRNNNVTLETPVEEVINNPFCLRVVCEGKQQAVRDPQQEGWVTLNYCSLNAPSSGMSDALDECGANSNSPAYAYFHRTEPGNTQSNIQIYSAWYNTIFKPRCGPGWLSYPDNSTMEDELGDMINLCLNNTGGGGGGGDDDETELEDI